MQAEKNNSAETTPCYRLRGKRLPPLSKDQIHMHAKRVLKIIRLSKKNSHKSLSVVENLYGNNKFPLVLDVVSDAAWFHRDIADGLWDSTDLSISIPESVYVGCSKNDPDALNTLFHEVGHCFLAHGVHLHHKDSETPPKEEEDSEYQADSFAEACLYILGFKEAPIKQLSLF